MSERRAGGLRTIRSDKDPREARRAKAGEPAVSADMGMKTRTYSFVTA